MKIPPILLSASCVFVFSLAGFAQTAEPGNFDPQSRVEAPASEVPLIPEDIPATQKPPSQRGGEKKSKTEEMADDLRQRIHFREAKTKALRDPKVLAELERARAVKTDLERREAMKSYYKLLFARITKIDGSLKKLADERQALALNGLEQTRIDPTQPLGAARR